MSVKKGNRVFQILKKFLTDETAAVGYMRALFLGAGGLLTAGAFPGIEATPWGAAVMAIGGMLRAGEKNKKGEKENA